MRNIPLYALLFLAVSPAFALDFSFEKNHCAAGEYRPKEPKSGGTSGLLDSTAWAEAGICVKIPIAKLQAAAADLGVMTWGRHHEDRGIQKTSDYAPERSLSCEGDLRGPPQASLVPIGAMADGVERPRD